MVKLSIGKLNIALENIEEPLLPENVLFFVTNFNKPDLKYSFFFQKELICPYLSDYTIISKKKDLTIYRNNKGQEIRFLYMPENNNLFAICCERDSGKIDIFYSVQWLHLINIETVFISTLALEKQLYKLNSFVFHCSFLDLDGNAILFSGPSGIGKTTHTNLWRKYIPDRTNIINGDKCLLKQEKDEFFAFGWPICGSSGICHNEKRKVKAIIMLQQSTENIIKEEKKTVIFKRILEQMTVNYWNSDFVNAAMDFALLLTIKIPCYTYACNISCEAVETLYRKINEKKNEAK